MRDALIVGASFAGVACAVAASRAGARVTLVERRHDPGERLHTTGIVVKEALAEIDAIARLPDALARPIAGVRLHAPGGTSLALDSPGYFFLATDTPALMRWLVDRARDHGVDVATGEPFEDARRTGGGWRTSAGREARFLVGADGPKSRVARVGGLGLNTKFLFGSEAEIVGATIAEPGRLHCFLDARRARGYIGWAFAGVGLVQAGVATSHARGGTTPDIDEFLAAIGPRIGLSGGHVSGRRAGLIPIGGPVRPRAGDRVTLVGDAAGLVSPLTAGGIHTALESGRRLGGSLGTALARTVPADGVRLVIDPPVPGFRAKRLARACYDRVQSDRLFDLAIGNPVFAALAKLVFFHRRGLASPAAWRDLLR